MPLKDVPTVHAVTDPAILARPDFVRQAAALLRALGPAAAIHLRGHSVPARQLLTIAGALVPLQAETGGWVIINDVALAAHARGVQLGQRALPLADVRRVAPLVPTGVSVHSEAEARAAREADWWLVGHLFDSPSHPGVTGRGVGLLTTLASFHVPMIAIGGMTPQRAADAREAGAHGVAAIRGIWSADDPARAATEYLS